MKFNHFWNFLRYHVWKKSHLAVGPVVNVLYSFRVNVLSGCFYFLTLLSECITPTDCTEGGVNFLCIANECQCPIPNFLDGDKCVGMLTFVRANSNCINFKFESWNKKNRHIICCSNRQQFWVNLNFMNCFLGTLTH